MDMFTDRDRMKGKSYDLIRLAYGLSCGNGAKGDLMSSGDVGECRDVKIRKELLSCDGLEGNRNIV